MWAGYRKQAVGLIEAKEHVAPELFVRDFVSVLNAKSSNELSASSTSTWCAARAAIR